MNFMTRSNEFLMFVLPQITADQQEQQFFSSPQSRYPAFNSVSSEVPVGSTLSLDFDAASIVPRPMASLGTEAKVLFKPSTIDKISQLLNLNEQPEIVEVFQPSESVQGHQKPSALFLVHDGSGVCTHYHRLASLHRPVYALHDPKLLDPFDSWSSLGEMADHYANVAESVTTGPYLVGGWSFGGVVAFEMARRLVSRGHEVLGTILIDSPPPINHQPLSPTIIDAVVGQSRLPLTETAKAIRSVTRHSFKACAGLLEAFNAPPPEGSFVPNIFLIRSEAGWRYPENPHYIENRWLQARDDPQEATAGWRTVTGSEVPCMDIPGDHFQVFDAANVDLISNALFHAASMLEAAFLGA